MSSPSPNESVILISFNVPSTFIRLTASSQLDLLDLIVTFFTIKFTKVKHPVKPL